MTTVREYYLLLTIALVVVLPSAHAGSTIAINPSHVRTVSVGNARVSCYQIRNVWEPGRLTSQRRFLPLKTELAEAKSKLKRTSRRNRRIAQQKVVKLTSLLKRNRSLCAQQATPTPTSVTATPTVIPIEPTATPTPLPPLPTDLRRLNRPLTRSDVLHLYRRAGLGPPPDEALSFIGQSPEALTTYFMTYHDEPETEAMAYQALDNRFEAPHYPDSRVSEQGLLEYALQLLSLTKNQFHERLAFIALHDRLSASAHALDVPNSSLGAYGMHLMLDHLMLLRRIGSREMDYPRLIEAIGEDPVMMLWLNIHGSQRAAPNENYARELMELFTLDTRDLAGNLNYTNEDIRTVARAFTGWEVQYSIEGDTDETRCAVAHVVLNPEFFDASHDKVIFAGTPYEGHITNGRDVVRHIFAHHPNAAISLARWIAREYIDPDLPTPLIVEMATQIKNAGFNLRPIFETLFNSDLFYHPRLRNVLLRHPAHRQVTALRMASRIATLRLAYRAYQAGLIGCPLTQPTSVFGCDRQQEVLISQRLLDSTNSISAHSVSWIPPQMDYRPQWTAILPMSGISDTQLVNYLEDRFGVELTTTQRTNMISYLNTRALPDGGMQTEPWDPRNAAMVNRKFETLVRLFFELPQAHELH